MSTIESEADLRTRYRDISERAQRKVLPRLDKHCQRFIGLSPFVALSTADADGKADVSPRGGEPGFVRCASDTRLLLPDSPGNNRLDSMSNIVANPEIAMLFLLPGVDETLRVNGTARVSDELELREQCQVFGRTPATVLVVEVREAYLHCAKALMRSKLWDPSIQIERKELPSMGQMLKEQIGLSEPAESQEALVERMRDQL